LPLRARLTFLYTSLLGGILLLFGVLVYVLVSALLLDQVDKTLNAAAQQILTNSRVDAVGELGVITLPSLELTTTVYVQLWDRQGSLRMASPGLDDITQPLAKTSMEAIAPIFGDNIIQNTHLRVLTVPLRVETRRVGVLQAATPLTLVDSVRNTLVLTLLGLAFVSMFLAAIASWVSLGQALAPLETATETAEQITRADDLSRRIFYNGPPDDEIGTLIRAFNRSLERLESLFTSQQRFLADVSHELRTPLTVIKGNVDLIRKLGPDAESLDSIRDEADRLTRMVGELLLIAQAESGKLNLNLSSVEMDSLLLEVFQQMRVLAGDKIALKLTEITPLTVTADCDRLKQVLINLVSNAIHYTPEGGQVTLSMTGSEQAVRIQIRDTGPGISAADFPHIFDRFYRGEKARTRSKTSGFGLGLSIAYWIVEAHKGKLEVESREGQGTTFIISLPCE